MKFGAFAVVSVIGALTFSAAMQPSAARAVSTAPVFDAIGSTGADPFLGAPSPSHSVMGQAFNAGPTGYSGLTLTQIDIVSATTASKSYDDVKVAIQFWGSSTNGSLATNPAAPVFSDPILAQPLTFDLGALTTNGTSSGADTSHTFSLSLISAEHPDGITMPGFENLGVSISFLTDSGNGVFTPDADLTTAVRNGLNSPFAAGSVPAVNPDRNDNTIFYRNASSTFDYSTMNFLSSDGRDIASDPNQGQFYSALAIRIHAVVAPEPGSVALLLCGGVPLGALTLVRRRRISY